MLKYIRKMRLLWAAATLIPFGLAFLLSWLFGSPGGWQISSQLKMFFLFLQIGFVTAFFCSRRLYQAAASLWGTILFLWLLSLIVPYLATQTNYLMDMADTTFEMSTPLYLFLSCLTAAWLLPGRGRMPVRIICLVLIFLYVFIQFTYVFAAVHQYAPRAGPDQSFGSGRVYPGQYPLCRAGGGCGRAALHRVGSFPHEPAQLHRGETDVFS